MAALGVDSLPQPLSSGERIAMESADLGPGLIGLRVRILSWFDFSDLFRHFARHGSMPAEPIGMVTGVDDYGSGHLEIQLRIEGFPRPFVFDAHELELLYGTTDPS
jgi:hypothetical protein